MPTPDVDRVERDRLTSVYGPSGFYVFSRLEFATIERSRINQIPYDTNGETGSVARRAVRVVPASAVAVTSDVLSMSMSYPPFGFLLDITSFR